MFWRRRAAALGVVALVVLAVVLGVRALGGSGAQRPSGAAAATAPPPPQLPRGGREILPRFRVVAFYGNPQDAELGTLGIGTPAQAGRRLLRRARTYRRLGRPVLPAMELIAVVAANAPGDDGAYRTRAPDAVIRRYLRAARRIRALLILDIQPGRSDFLRETVRLERWLREPDVSLALDPEWRVDAPQVPGQVIGSVSAQEVNAVSFWLARLVRERDLPQKLLLVHRFTEGMIGDAAALKQRPGLAMAVNVDGFGSRAVKIAKYEHFAATAPPGFHDGLKLFFKEDTDLLTPRAVARLRPRPDVVVYE
jgi:hypothetical protein